MRRSRVVPGQSAEGGPQKSTVPAVLEPPGRVSQDRLRLLVLLSGPLEANSQCIDYIMLPPEPVPGGGDIAARRAVPSMVSDFAPQIQMNVTFYPRESVERHDHALPSRPMVRVCASRKRVPALDVSECGEPRPEPG